MSLYTFSKSNKMLMAPKPQGLRIEESTDITLLAIMGTTTVEDVINRLGNDHVAFVAYLNQQPAAFGWMARGKAMIGELNHEIILPIGNRYLWNFRTLEPFRGMGIYPAVLQFIINYEAAIAHRFWIIHSPENKSSLSGISKAGFQFVGKLFVNYEWKPAIETNNTSVGYGKLLADMDIALSSQQPASCWNCSSPYLKKRTSECCCSPASMECIGKNEYAMAF